MKTALLWVDIQNDFVADGALAVPQGEQVVPVANRLAERFELVVASQDWHPEGHGSFASAHPGRAVGDVVDLNGLPQVLWPDHCVQGTRGADFVESLRRDRITHMVRKGTDPACDSYSAFFDNGKRNETGLHALLAGLDVGRLVVVGLATDYCVRATVLDARLLGYAVDVVREGVRGVELRAGDAERALDAMAMAGARIVDEHAA